MVSFSQVTNGAAQYIESEIIAKLTDWRKWVLGAGVSLALQNVSGSFATFKNHPIIKMLGVVDENDMIDINKIYEEISKRAQNNSVTFDVPVLGALTLNSQDVDKIYQCIINSGGVIN